MTDEQVGQGTSPPPSWSGFGSEGAGFVRRPPPVGSPPTGGSVGTTIGPPPIQDEISPTEEEFQQAFKAVAQFENRDFDSLSQEEKQTVIQNTLIMNKYTALNPDYASLVIDKTLYDTAQEVASAFAGRTVSAQVLAIIRTGRPLPPPGTRDISGVNAAVPNDIAGNEWFSGNALLTLHLAAIDLAKTNRDAALVLGLMEGGLMKIFMETNIELAELKNKEYKKQADMAMWEMIGASVSLGVTVASMSTTVAFAGIGFAKGVKGVPETPATFEADGTTVKTWTAGSPGGWKGGIKGAGEGSYQASLVTGQMTQAGGHMGQIMTNIAKMIDLKDIGELQRSETLAQATADLLKKAMESCSEESRAALEHNEQLRAFLKASDDERVRIFGSITAHG